MTFSVSGKTSKKLVMNDENKKRRFTMTYKGSKKNLHIVMKDRKRAVIYTVYPGYYSGKPQIRIFSGEECILTCNCLNMFVDRELVFIFMGNIRYRLKAIPINEEKKSAYEIIDERDNKKIGTVILIRNEKGERSFSVDADDQYYRDYMVLFPLCLELCYYKNENN